MKANNSNELVRKVREAGGEYSLYEILDYAERSGISFETLNEMSGPAIVMMIEDYLDLVYGSRIW